MQAMDEDLHSRLINSSIGFMQTIAEIYGSEKGLELWETIADTVDADLKGQVFLALLTGNYNKDKLHVRNPFLGPVGNKVALIKCIRNYDRRALGLKEAKDIADRLESGGTEVLEVLPEIRSTFVIELRKLGMVV